MRYSVKIMRVYAIRSIRSKRDSVLFDPWPNKVVEVEFEGAAYWQDRIWKFVNDYFHGKTFIFGMSREFAFLYIYRYYLYLKYVQGFGSAGSFPLATVRFKALVSAKAAAVGWVAVGLAVGVVILGVVFAVADWLEKDDGYFNLPDGAVFLRYNERLWWGGLVARPDYRAFDFHRCKMLGEMCWYERRITGDGIGGIDLWDTLDLWELKTGKRIGWYVYRFGNITVRYLGNASNRGWDRYRLIVPEGYDLPYDKPLSWGISDGDACRYVGELNRYFRA